MHDQTRTLRYNLVKGSRCRALRGVAVVGVRSWMVLRAALRAAELRRLAGERFGVLGGGGVGLRDEQGST